MPSPDKINIEKDVHDIYIQLTKEDGSDIMRPFRTMKDLFLASAVFGYLNDKYVPVKTSRDIFGWGTLLNDDHGLTVLRSIALSKTEDPNVLLDDAKIGEIAEGYANGGIHLLAKKILQTDTTELEEAALLMSEYTNSINDTEEDN